MVLKRPVSIICSDGAFFLLMEEARGEEEGTDGDAEVPVVVVGGGVVAVGTDRPEGEGEHSLNLTEEFGTVEPSVILRACLGRDQ